MEIFCDGLLVLAAIAFVCGLGFIIWGFFGGFAPFRLVAGILLLAVSAMLLFIWERLAWEPFAKTLSHIS
jgi:hypothetical protein